MPNTPRDSETDLLIDRHFGSEDALDNADAITATLILEWLRNRPAVSRVQIIGLTAIAALSDTKPDLARMLIAEWTEETK